MSFGWDDGRGSAKADGRPVRSVRREGPPSSSPTGNHKRMLPAELSPKWMWVLGLCILLSAVNW